MMLCKTINLNSFLHSLSPLGRGLLLLVLLLVGTAVHAQKITVAGTITDDRGERLVGATIMEKGTANGTVTDLNGLYSLEVEDATRGLVISYTGYETKEIAIDGQSRIDIQMESDVAQLEEVVVLGYGSQKKKDLTGSVSVIEQETYQNVFKNSFEEGLAGMAAGVLINQGNAQPGGSVNIRIRGITTINGGNDPLIVIDGVRIDNSNESSGANFGPEINPLATLDPNNIASINILKDASATSVYGAAGANGVIVITTKRGESGKNRLTFSSSIGLQQVNNRLDVLDGPQYIAARNQAILNDAEGDLALAEQSDNWLSDSLIQLAGNFDWQDEVLRTGLVQSYRLNASGGTGNSTSEFSGKWLRPHCVATRLRNTCSQLHISHRVEDLRVTNDYVLRWKSF